jgi:hypothetical protein
MHKDDKCFLLFWEAGCAIADIGRVKHQQWKEVDEF